MAEHIDSMTTEQRVAVITDMARALVATAEELGVTLRITHKPHQPPVTGKFDHVVEAWPARHGPRAQPAP